MKARGFSFWSGGDSVGCLLGASRPPPYYFGVAFFDAWLLGIYVSAAPTASTDAPSTRGRRAPSRVVRASRPLLRRAGAWSFPTRVFLVFYLSAATASTRTVSFACGFRAQAKKKRRAAAARVIRVVSESFRSRQLGAAVASTRARTDHSPAHIAAETAAHTRRNDSARDEGRAAERRNG